MINFLPERERKLGNFTAGLILVLGDKSGFHLSVGFAVGFASQCYMYTIHLKSLFHFGIQSPIVTFSQMFSRNLRQLYVPARVLISSRDCLCLLRRSYA